MESNIVRDFENLRVFAKHNFISMDELVHDLNTALEETAAGNAATEAGSYNALSKRYVKKRRGLRRPSANAYYWKKGTISEASESSVDEQSWHDLGVNVVQSDSDDLVACRRIHKLSKPIIDSVPPVESDSFTENLSPMRPQRRRRKLKNMAIDSSPLTDHGPSDVDSLPGDKQHLYKRNLDTLSSMPTADYHAPCEPPKSTTVSTAPCTFMSGKRKRSSKCRVDYSSPQGDVPLQAMAKAIQDRMDVTSISQESSLSSSEFDSDINVNTEDAREADDEQSDFFHEPGPACGIPDIVPWWENERVTDKPLINSDFEKILTGTFEHLPKYSSQGFKAKVGKLVSGAGREIRLGRRKLKGKMPRYTVGRFLQDREHWSRLQDPHSVQMASNSNNNSNNNNNNNGQAGEFKKRKHQQRNCQGEGSSSAEPVADGIKASHKSSLNASVSKSSSSPNVTVRRSCRKSGSSSVSDS